MKHEPCAFWWCGKKDCDGRMSWCSEGHRIAHRARERAANPHAKPATHPRSEVGGVRSGDCAILCAPTSANPREIKPE